MAKEELLEMNGDRTRRDAFLHKASDVLGAQAVGMSTVPEIIALRHMRVPAAALSCITNLAAGISKTELDHAEVEETARRKRGDLVKLLGGWIEKAGA